MMTRKLSMDRAARLPTNLSTIYRQNPRIYRRRDDPFQYFGVTDCIDLARAIALYNSYGFGYALGMNFRNADGRREMLWPPDLDEIDAAGKTREGGYIH